MHVLSRLLFSVWVVLATQTAAWAQDFLEPEQAFKITARVLDSRSIEVSFTVAPGYYLYREQFQFAATGAELGTPQLPRGKIKYDETFAKDVETYRDVLRVPVTVASAGNAFSLLVTSQGCADAGLCYPPMQSSFRVGLAASGNIESVQKVPVGNSAGALVFGGGASAGSPGTGALLPRGSTGAPDVSRPAAAAPANHDDRLAGGNVSPAGDNASSALGSALRDGRFWPVVATFFFAGVLLSLTPCVLPMLPIVSAIIAGHGARVTKRRGLALAGAYSFGMALVYSALGVAAGLAGEGLAAALQTPAVLAAFAAGLVALALSMFGAYELRLPAAFTSQIVHASNRLPAGNVAGVCAMGGISALIVSPCVAAPLAGALVYLSQTRDVWLGGTALFSLALGMSLPLLLVGASAGSLLPRAGPWMNDIKVLFGLLLLGVALWTVHPVLPTAVTLVLWGALAFGASFLFMAPLRVGSALQGSSSWYWRPVGALLLALVGVGEWVGAGRGASDPLRPLAVERATAGSTFHLVRTVAELESSLLAAGKPVMLDFYADWCVSCKEMERFTLSDPAIQAKLRGAVLLKADVTANSLEDRALLKRFGLFGPPGTIFFDANGREIAAARVIGYQNTSRFIQTLKVAGL